MFNHRFAQYNKTLVAVVVVVLSGLNTVYGSSQVVQLLLALAGAAGVYAVPNKVVK